MTVKDLYYATVNGVNPLCLIINKINGYIEESSANKYLTLVPTVENNNPLKRNAELWSKIGDLIRSVTNKSGDDDKKYIKIKFDRDDDYL